MQDSFGRVIDYARISVTDRCNLRCIYCMPETGIALMQCHDLLSYEEILKACHAFGQVGIKKIKITGGEPLVRLDICQLIGAIKKIAGIEQVTLTTNGVLVAEMAEDLIAAGIDGINISLDTTDPGEFMTLTRRDQLPQVLRGISRLLELGYPHIKLNCVPVQGFNEAQLVKIAAFARDYPISVRFIELMPIGLAEGYSAVPKSEIIARLEDAFGALTLWSGKLGNGPAEYYTVSGFQGKIGFIEALNHKFCDHCNRIRLTSNGFLKLCLHYNKGVDIMGVLRGSDDLTQITDVIKNSIFNKPKEHHFGNPDLTEDADQRKMFQIGG